jgi:hypothetical protein
LINGLDLFDRQAVNAPLSWCETQGRLSVGAISQASVARRQVFSIGEEAADGAADDDDDDDDGGGISAAAKDGSAAHSAHGTTRTKTRHPIATSSGSSKPWALL